MAFVLQRFYSAVSIWTKRMAIMGSIPPSKCNSLNCNIEKAEKTCKGEGGGGEGKGCWRYVMHELASRQRERKSCSLALPTTTTTTNPTPWIITLGRFSLTRIGRNAERQMMKTIQKETLQGRTIFSCIDEEIGLLVSFVVALETIKTPAPSAEGCNTKSKKVKGSLLCQC